MNVLVINQCSTNKGDRAVLYFVLRELKANGIDNVTVSTSNPQYWLEKPDFPEMDVWVIPWGWDISLSKNANIACKVLHLFFKKKMPRLIHFPLIQNSLITGKNSWYLRHLVNKQYLEAVQNSDLIISTGGHHLTTIIAGYIRTPQIFDLAVALLYKKPLVLWSQSIGSFKFMSPSDKSLIQKILSGTEQIFIRDENSLVEIEKLDASTKNVIETRESVFGLFDVVRSRIVPSRRNAVLGISVWTGNKHNNRAWQAYTHCFAELIDYALESRGYKQVRFFPMELRGYDRSCIENITKLVRKKNSCFIVEDFPGTVEHINEVSKCRMFIGHKTHSQIFALVAGTPLLAIAYHKKTEDFMKQFELEQYCISDEQLNIRRLIEIFDAINENLDLISVKQQETAFKLYEKVKADFSKMIQSELQKF